MFWLELLAFSALLGLMFFALGFSQGDVGDGLVVGVPMFLFALVLSIAFTLAGVA